MADACLHAQPVQSCLLLIKCDGLHIITGTLASTLPGATTGGPLARRPAVFDCRTLGLILLLPQRENIHRLFNITFFIYCVFLRGAENITVVFPPRIKAAACFAIT